MMLKLFIYVYVYMYTYVCACMHICKEHGTMIIIDVEAPTTVRAVWPQTS